MERCRPGAAASIQSRLTRLPIRLPRGRFGSELCLARKLSNLISMKGEDILLSTPSTQLVRYHRLRASVPASLWKWKVVSGWQWTRGKEHINCLEMRAILNALRWRLEHQQHLGCRMVHLTVAWYVCMPSPGGGPVLGNSDPLFHGLTLFCCVAMPR